MARIGSIAAFVLLLLALLASAAGAVPDRELTIAVIPKGTTHEFWKSVHAGAVKAAGEGGTRILWKGPAREDARADQIKVVEDFVTRRVDGIVIAPLDDIALVRPLKEAVEEGIPVVIIDSGIRWDGYLAFVATDNFQGGVLAANELGRQVGGKGKVLMLRYVVGSSSTSKREEGFLETMKKSWPDIKVVSSNQYGGATPEGCLKAAENLLTKYEDIDGAFAPCEPISVAFMQALKSTSRKSQVKLVGFDASEVLVAGLESSAIDALVVQDPMAMGDKGVGALLAHLAGKPVDRSIDTGCHVVTRENMKTPEIDRLLHPPLKKYLGNG
ncbi:MAG: substrate-binding domain-containing protein [Phycisphaerales bacterium]|jgi:ribose transport system substrate-binding protein|nr:substrate-binding domain-containing protein [Phycisphaerales bacterium]